MTLFDIMKKPKMMAATLGHILERYDVMLYGFLSSYLAKFFFPPEHFQNSILLTYGSFAAGYVMRPFGGAFFGYIGDRYGRKRALVLSIMLVSIPTAIIGLLPTYNEIGMLSPILLLACRLLQGICVAGEYSGASIYFYEHAPTGKHSSTCGVMAATAFLGALIATLVATIFIHDWMPSWGWRIPFILGSALGPVSFIFRRRMLETDDFLELQKKKKLLKAPILSVFKQRKLSILSAVFVGAQGHIPLYIATVYTNTLLTKLAGSAQWLVTLDNCCILCLWVTLIILSSLLADKIGKGKVMLGACLLACVMAYPIYAFLYAAPSLERVILMQVILSICGASFVGPAASLLPELFKTNERYSGIGFSLTLGQAMIGGMTPIFAALFVGWLGDPRAPFLLVIAGGLAGIIAVWIWKTRPYEKSRVIPRNNTKTPTPWG